jgi:hypothetical protein
VNGVVILLIAIFIARESMKVSLQPESVGA